MVLASVVFAFPLRGQITQSTEGVTGLPADISSMLSLAGIWSPVADRDITPQNHGQAVDFAGNLKLHNGREGLVFAGWSFAGFSNADTKIVPVHVALLEQQADGTLQLVTERYIADTTTNGAGSVVVADFNRDSIDDVFLASWNEAPNIPASSTAFLSNRSGYDRVQIDDFIYAHGATVADIQGQPIVFTAGYYNASGRGNTIASFDGLANFRINHNTGIVGTSSMAVADFYGTGTYSAVFSDLTWGPGLPYDPANHGIYLYNLRDMLPAGKPYNVGRPYFDDKPQYASYPSAWDPHKTHNYRVWVDDFNHDRKVDILAQGQLWHPNHGAQKDMLQLFQNEGDYLFRDVTASLNPDYDENCYQHEYQPQLRDIDDSGINSYLFATPSYDRRPPCNYIFVNDGTGRLQVALHETLNRYGEQIMQWVRGRLPAGYSASQMPQLRAYQTPDRKLNFLAAFPVALTRGGDYVSRFAFVNLPLQLDLKTQYRRALTIRAQNGSSRIRTFAGDDVIYLTGESGATVDGGEGTNTVIYPRPRQNYAVTQLAGDRWQVTNGGSRDTLVRIQRIEFDGVVGGRRQ